MKSILLPRSYSSPSGVVNIANEVLRGGFDEFPDLMYETIYVFGGSNGRCRLVAKIDVEVEGCRIEVVDRPWFVGSDVYTALNSLGWFTLGSLVAYCCSQTWDVFIFHKLKESAKKRLGE